jgi:hypothetical protein
MKCLDTYALVEIHDENPDFLPYLEKEFIIPNIIMAEFYGIIFRNYNEQTANYLLKKFQPFIMNVSFDTIIKSVNFRYLNKAKNFSFFDAVGYTFARENHMTFVTGDLAFKEIEGVEFIK